MSQWPSVELGRVLRQVVDGYPVRTDQTYPTFGVYGFGRGLFPKPPIPGATIKAEKLYRVRKGQFIYSRLKAFEGAYAVVPDELDGHYVSNEFPTFECLTDRLLSVAEITQVPRRTGSQKQARIDPLDLSYLCNAQ